MLPVHDTSPSRQRMPSALLRDYLAWTPKSRALAARAKNVLANGVSTDTRIFDPYGIYVARALGREKWDVDGHRYLDFFGGHGALMLGHAHPVVVDAVTRAFGNGIQYAANHPGEVAWAETLTTHFPNMARMRFTASGSEATLLALRIARAYTGRTKTLRVITHYHGWHDFAVSGYNAQFDGKPAAGVLPEIAANTLLVRPDDPAGLAATMAAHGVEIAAVILEPLGAHFGNTPTSDQFIRELARQAAHHGALLIFDEVISAFRVGPGGLQAELGIVPDLTCFAKIAAGGMPGGAVGGREEVMAVLASTKPNGLPNDRRVFHQGTFTGNPVTAAAAVATINEIVTGNLCTRASRLAEGARNRLNDLFRCRGSSWWAYGRYSALNLLPLANPLKEDSEELSFDDYLRKDGSRLNALRIALNLEGIDIGSRGTAFMSGVHEPEDVDALVEGFDRALSRLDAE